MSQQAQQKTDNPIRNSILKKLSPSLRRQLDRSIADRDPPTYRETFALFQLAEQGISYSAFYRYARKVRLEIEFIHTAAIAFPDGRSIHAILPNLIAARLLEIINDPDNPPKSEVILRLTRAHRAATQTLIAIQRQKEKTASSPPRQQPEQPNQSPPHQQQPDQPFDSVLDGIRKEILSYRMP